MDLKLFETCLEIFFEREATDRIYFAKNVAALFSSTQKISIEKRRTSLSDDFFALFAHGARASNVEEILKNLRQPRGDLTHSFKLAWLAYQHPEYKHLRTELERCAFADVITFGTIVEKCKRDAEQRLGRPPQPSLQKPELDDSYDLEFLHFAYDRVDKIPILGRNEQIANLNSFLEAEEPFLWVQLSGAAGQGKSRLAWEFVNEVRQRDGIDAGFLGAKELSDFRNKWGSWQPKVPVLMVVDYVSEVAPNLGPMMATLIERSKEFKSKVRLLLIERQRWDSGATKSYTSSREAIFGEIEEFDVPNLSRHAGVTENDFVLSLGRADWFERLIRHTDDRSTSDNPSRIYLNNRDFFFGETGVIEVTPLEPEQLSDIAIDVAKLRDGNFVQSHSSSSIQSALARFDNAGRPLYAYFVGIALADGSFQESWEETELLDSVLSIYSRKRWPTTKSGAHLTPGDEHEGLNLAAVATVLRALPYEALTNWPGSSNTKREDYLTAMSIVGAAKGTGAGALGNVIPCMLPDLLGEWFVLRHAQYNTNFFRELFPWCWQKDPLAVANFLTRLSADFTRNSVILALLDREPEDIDAKKVYASAISSSLISTWQSTKLLNSKELKLLERSALLGNKYARRLSNLISYRRTTYDAGDLERPYRPTMGPESPARGATGLEDVSLLANIAFRNEIHHNERQKENDIEKNRSLSRFLFFYLLGTILKIGTYFPFALNNRWLKNFIPTDMIYKIGVSLDLDYVSRKQNVALSNDLYAVAVEMGHAGAAFRLAMNLESLNGSDRYDPIEVNRLLEKAAALEHTGAIFALAVNVESGTGFETPNPEFANKLYMKAANLNHVGSMFYLASNLQEGIGTSDLAKQDEANRLFCKAAGLGDAPSMVSLGLNLQKGSGFKKKYPRYANALYRRSSELGSSYGSFALALNIQSGIGVRHPDEAEAERLHRRAEVLENSYGRYSSPY